jgi:hypothetical protein
MQYFIILVVLISFISGCSRNEPYLIRHSYATNYKIADVQTAFTGQSIVRVKDYYAAKHATSDFREPTKDFILMAKAPGIVSVYNLKISGLKGKQYDTYGGVRIGGILYELLYPVDSNGSNQWGIMVDDSGTILKNKLYYKNMIVTPTDFDLQPSDVKFSKAVITYDSYLCDSEYSYHYYNTCGFINYELIYSGINDVSMNVTYREYSRRDYAKPAYYQNLTYEPKTKQIRFRDTIIEVIEVNNDKIVYKVLADGLKDTEFVDGTDLAYEQFKLEQAEFLRLHNRRR